MRQIIITFFLVFLSLNLLSNETDTLKIKLKINNWTKDASKNISILFRSKKEIYNTTFSKDYILFTSLKADTTEIVIVYRNEEICSCFKYAPENLKDIKSLNIEIFTSKKVIARKSKEQPVDGFVPPDGNPKSICILTTDKGMDCICRNWTQ